jgi:hypothetical protein
MQALLLVAEHHGPTMFAGIGVMRADHRHKPKARPAPRRIEPKVYRFIDRLRSWLLYSAFAEAFLAFRRIDLAARLGRLIDLL